jgi:hypothetical protein
MNWYDCGSPEWEDFDETTGERFCHCPRCEASRKKVAREEAMADDYGNEPWWRE